MTPAKFPEQNGILRGGPAERYGTDEPVADLPIWRGDGHVISCWRLSWRERLRLLVTGRVWLHAAASTHPPVALESENPFGPERGAL